MLRVAFYLGLDWSDHEVSRLMDAILASARVYRGPDLRTVEIEGVSTG
jgi:hypothetical protein